MNASDKERAIVRDLANSDPSIYVPGLYDVSDLACRFCGATKYHPREMPDKHKPECVWFRANELTEG